jgi:hypothetical protein
MQTIPVDLQYLSSKCQMWQFLREQIDGPQPASLIKYVVRKGNRI